MDDHERRRYHEELMERARKAIDEARRLRQDFKRSAAAADAWNLSLANRSAAGPMRAEAPGKDAVTTVPSVESPAGPEPAEDATLALEEDADQ